MNIIRDTDALRAYCDAARAHEFVCIDTEFMRESTFFSILCLVQVATVEEDAIIDPLADGIDLTPLKELLMDTTITKVLHAARQDMEIFYRICDAVPGPIFDTQIAGMAIFRVDLKNPPLQPASSKAWARPSIMRQNMRRRRPRSNICRLPLARALKC